MAFSLKLTFYSNNLFLLVRDSPAQPFENARAILEELTRNLQLITSVAQRHLAIRNASVSFDNQSSPFAIPALPSSHATKRKIAAQQYLGTMAWRSSSLHLHLHTAFALIQHLKIMALNAEIKGETVENINQERQYLSEAFSNSDAEGSVLITTAMRTIANVLRQTSEQTSINRPVSSPLLRCYPETFSPIHPSLVPPLQSQDFPSIFGKFLGETKKTKPRRKKTALSYISKKSERIQKRIQKRSQPVVLPSSSTIEEMPTPPPPISVASFQLLDLETTNVLDNSEDEEDTISPQTEMQTIVMPLTPRKRPMIASSFSAPKKRKKSNKSPFSSSILTLSSIQSDSESDNEFPLPPCYLESCLVRKVGYIESTNIISLIPPSKESIEPPTTSSSVHESLYDRRKMLLAPFFAIESEGIASFQNIWLKYMLTHSKRKPHLRSNIITRCAKNLQNLKDIISLPKMPLIKYQEPVFNRIISLPEEEKITIMKIVLQGLQANLAYTQLRLLSIFESSKQQQELLQTITESIQLTKKYLQQHKSLPSQDFLRQSIFAPIPLMPFQVFGRLIHKKQQQSTNCVPCGDNSSSETAFAVYMFSVEPHTDQSGEECLITSYSCLLFHQEQHIIKGCHIFLKKTLSHISVLLKNNDSRVVSRVVSIDNTGEEITLTNQNLWLQLYEGVKETELFLKQYIPEILHPKNRCSLINNIEKILSLLKDKCPPSIEKTVPTIIPALMESKLRHKPLLQPFSTSSTWNLEPFTSSATAKHLPLLTHHSSEKIMDSPKKLSTTSIKIMDSFKKLPTTSAPLLSTIDKPSHPYIIPYFNIRRFKLMTPFKFNLFFTTKCVIRLQLAKDTSRKTIHKTIEYIRYMISLYQNVDNPLPVKCVWNPPCQRYSANVSLLDALLISCHGLELTRDYHLSHTPNALKIGCNLLEKSLNQCIEEIKAVTNNRPCPKAYVQPSNLLETIVKTQRSQSITPLEKTQPTSSKKSLTSSYVFSIQKKGKRPDGSYHTYLLSYAKRIAGHPAILQTKCRESIVQAAETALDLLKLTSFPSHIFFSLPSQQAFSSITSWEKLKEILLEGLEENKLFYEKFLTNALNKTKKYDPVAQLTNTINFVRSTFSSVPPEKSFSTIIAPAIANDSSLNQQEWFIQKSQEIQSDDED